MGKILRVLLLLAFAAAVVGYFRNWYSVTRQDEQQHTNITIHIDRQRVRHDLDVAAAKVRRLAGREPAAGDQTSAEDGSSRVTQWSDSR